MSKVTASPCSASAIGPYTFEEYMRRAAVFHGTPAPGIVVGGFMVEAVRERLPAGMLYDAVVETKKCLPDAVQLLTPPSFGNGWMRVHNLGRYALSLFDRHTGEGIRAWLDPAILTEWPEILAWYLKTKPKREQDRVRLYAEIKAAGRRLCRVAPVVLRPEARGRGLMGAVGICPVCGEGYPLSDGACCLACAGRSPYAALGEATGTALPEPSPGPVNTSPCLTCPLCTYPRCPFGKGSP